MDREESSSGPQVNDEEQALVQQCYQEFLSENYMQTIKLLDRLSTMRGEDIKILHNKAVVEFARSKMTQTDEFKAVLRELATKAQINLDSASSLDDVDHYALYYNHAILLFHLRQYHQSLAIVDKLFQFLEPMEDTFAKKVVCLLVEIYLRLLKPEQAMNAIGIVEKIQNSGKFQGGSQAEKGDEREKREAAEAVEQWKMKLCQYRVRCALMMKNMKACKREVKLLLGAKGMTPAVAYLKANFEYARGNYRKVLKMLNTAPRPAKPASESGESVTMMYNNNTGVVHFHWQKFDLGLFYLRHALQENFLAVKEYNTVNPTKSLSGRPLHTVGMSRHHELIFNTGIMLLHSQRPAEAFECLLESVQTFRSNPRLWLRLAECCTMAHCMNNDEEQKMSRRLQVVQGVVGVGLHRKIVLGSLSSKPVKEKQASESAAIPSVTLEFAALCLRNARVLLPEPAPPLSEEMLADLADSGRPPQETFVQAAPSNPMHPGEVANLRCSVLVLSVYVALCLNDHLTALELCDQLLKQPKLSGAHQYLARMYMAEALVAIDKIADAVQHLNIELVTDVSVIFPESKADPDKNDKNGDKEPGDVAETPSKLTMPWSPQDVPKAQAIMQYNLAVCHAIRGEYEKALDLLNKSTQGMGLPLPAPVYSLKLYLELTTPGRKRYALGIIKDHFGHLGIGRV